MKNLVLLLMLLVSFTSCITQKKCQRRYPPEVITETKVVEKEKIVYRDTVIYREIPGKEVRVEIPVEVKTPYGVPIKTPVFIDTMMIQNDYAMAFAWVNNSVMGMQLNTKPQKFQFDLKNQYLYSYLEKGASKKEVEIREVVPLIYKISLGILILQLIFVVLYLLWKNRGITK